MEEDLDKEFEAQKIDGSCLIQEVCIALAPDGQGWISNRKWGAAFNGPKFESNITFVHLVLGGSGPVSHAKNGSGGKSTKADEATPKS